MTVETKRLASQVDTYPLNQGQISVFTEELLKLSLLNSHALQRGMSTM